MKFGELKEQSEECFRKNTRKPKARPKMDAKKTNAWSCFMYSFNVAQCIF